MIFYPNFVSKEAAIKKVVLKISALKVQAFLPKILVKDELQDDGQRQY